jgi:hypothetical protein
MRSNAGRRLDGEISGLGQVPPEGLFCGNCFLRSNSLLNFTWDSVMPADMYEPVVLRILAPLSKHLKINA